MLAGLALFYVGAVLCLNGLWLLGRIGDKEIAVIDISLAESRCWWPIEGVQLVLSTGKNVDINALRPLPANAIVAPSLPQVELLSRASICITHAGINTVLEALSAGVPLVAIPVGFDQPGIAARIAYHKSR